MSHIKAYLELTRPVNAVIAAASIFIGAFVTGGIEPIWNVIIACLSGMCIAGGGNAINDYFDTEVDRINHPQRPLPSERASRIGAFIFSMILLVTGIRLGFLLGLETGAIALCCSIVLFFYSFRFKHIALLGNGLVSFIASFAFIYGGLAVGRFGPTLIPAWFAFLFHLGREIIKDIQDCAGDTTVRAQTLPIRYGQRAALIVTSYIFILLIISTIVPFLFRIYGLAYLIVVILGVDIPVMYIIRSMWDDPGPSNLGRISFILKLDMLAGLLAIYLGAGQKKQRSKTS